MNVFTEDALKGARCIVSLYNSIVHNPSPNDLQLSSDGIETNSTNGPTTTNPPCQNASSQQHSGDNPSNVLSPVKTTKIKLDSLLTSSQRDLRVVPPHHRPTAYLLLLGIESPFQTPQPSHSEKRLSDYKTLLQTRPAHPSDASQITKDIIRLPKDFDKFQPVLKRILCLWAAEHPAYLEIDNNNQDLDTTITIEEANASSALSSALAPVQDFYTAEQPKIITLLKIFPSLLYQVDPTLSSHLTTLGVEPTTYAFKWLNCFLLREFSPPQAARILDVLVAEKKGFAEFPIFLCVSLVVSFKQKILGLDFPGVIELLLRPPTADWGGSRNGCSYSTSTCLSRIIWKIVNV
ncbi:Rab-GAP TBC domain-containing protein [Entamoeba marina]